MKLLGTPLLRNFVEKYSDSRSDVESWTAEIKEIQWATPHALKEKYPKASILKNQNVIFNICGNKYRLWVKINYKGGVVLIKEIGTHKEYDKWKII